MTKETCRESMVKELNLLLKYLNDKQLKALLELIRVTAIQERKEQQES